MLNNILGKKKALPMFIFIIIIFVFYVSCTSNDFEEAEVAVADITEQFEILKLEQDFIDNDAKIIIEDSLRFKQEYEALNDELNDDGTNRYAYMSIDEDNNIVYLTYADLVDFTSNGTGLLYFGRPACPWCRLLVPHLFEYAKEADVNIYYYDIEQDRDENNEQYQNILTIFRGYLPTDTVTQNEDDPEFNPGLKRVVLPQLFFMDNGAIKSDLFMFRHEYLEHDESEKVKQLLHAMHDTGNCEPCD